jgi:hypothetical protein
MNFFISYNQYKKEFALNETYESYEELKELAQDILKGYNDSDKFPMSELIPIKKFAKKEYKVIKDFLNTNISIVWYYSDDKEFRHYAGTFFTPDEYNNKNLEKKYPHGYIAIYFMSSKTVLHELQHAYDSFRSKGKFSYSKMGYKQREFLDTPANKISHLTHEDIDKRYKKLYYRSPHELSAYFVKTLDDINFFRDKKELILKDIHDVYAEFEEKFDGYDYLTPKDKKMLARKFSQYYYKLKERNIGDE